MRLSFLLGKGPLQKAALTIYLSDLHFLPKRRPIWITIPALRGVSSNGLRQFDPRSAAVFFATKDSTKKFFSGTVKWRKRRRMAPRGEIVSKPCLRSKLGSRERCGIHDQDFGDLADGDRLLLRDRGEDRELSGADAGAVEGRLVKRAAWRGRRDGS